MVVVEKQHREEEFAAGGLDGQNLARCAATYRFWPA
jgi:hypothetical protein